MTIDPADAQEQFNRQAANYAVSVPHRSSESLRILTEWAALDRYGVGLDIATGPGFTAFAVAPYCGTVVASDIAERMLNQARGIASERNIENMRFEIIDALDIPYPDASIDLVTCRTAPHHFPDIPVFLAQVHRVLKSTGVFLLCDTTTSEIARLANWHQSVEAARDTSHVNAPPPSEWRQLIHRAGFEITHEHATRVNMTFWDWVQRSGTPDDVAESLHREFAGAGPATEAEYGIESIADHDFKFHWPVFNCRAVKAGESIPH